MADTATYEPRLKTRYREEIRAKMKEKFGYANDMMIPSIDKVVINMGVGEAAQDSKKIKAALEALEAIAGQKPVATKARTSVAGFKLRDGMPIGASVTLRGAKMWEFVDRLVAIAVPRIRDFRGLPTKFDGRGNYSMGLSEQSVFPEINLDKVDFVQGMHITFVTSAPTDEEGFALLQKLGMPFQK